MTFQSVFLVGGFGTRLGALTRETPKPLLPVGGRPFIEYLVEQAVRQGSTEILLVAGHLGDIVRTQYHGVTHDGARIAVVVEPEPAGTAGALRVAADALDDVFLLANGDSFFNLPIEGFMREPFDGATLVRVALRRIEDVGRYGAVDLDDGGAVTAFAEKRGTGAGLVNAGVYRIDKRLVARIPPTGAASLEQDLFPALVAERRLEGRVFDGFFIDIGVPDDLARAQTLIPAEFAR